MFTEAMTKNPLTPTLNAEDKVHADRLTDAMADLDRVIVALEDRGDRKAADELADAFSVINRHRDRLRG